MAGISIPFVADVRSFLKGTQDAEGALSDVIDALDDVAQQGKDTERVLTDSMRQVERDTDDATDNLTREFRDAFDDIERDARTSGKKAGKNFADGVDDEVDKGSSNIKEAGKEAGSEFAANLGEGISSGNFSDIAQATAGGLAATFGQAGPIGLALAALGGVGVAVFSGLQRRAEALSAATQTYYDDLIGKATEQAQRVNRLEEAFGKGDYVSNLAEAQRIADALGADVTDVVDSIVDANTESATYKRVTQDIADITQKNIDTAGELTHAEELKAKYGNDYLDAVNRAADAKKGAVKAAETDARITNSLADDGERHARAAQDALEARRKEARLTEQQIAKAKRLEAVERRTLSVLKQQNDAKRRDPRYVN